jgi:hypothetical protein
MTSARTLIINSLAAVIAVTVFTGGIASASTGSADAKHGHCRHTTHGHGHAYGHRNHDHECTDTDDSSPSTTVPVEVPIANETNNQVPTEPHTPATPSAPDTSVAPRDITSGDESAPEPLVVTPSPTEVVIGGDSRLSPQPLETSGGNVRNDVDTKVNAPSRNADIAPLLADELSPITDALVAKNVPQALEKFSAGAGAGNGSSIWWLVILLAIAAEATRRARRARVETADSALAD